MSKSLEALCAQLEALWYETIPLTRALGVRVDHFDGDTLRLAADLGPNVNLHGTAFAGSLYAITALTGWSMVHLQLALREQTASIILAEGRIRYLKPVTDTIVAECVLGDQDAAFDTLSRTGKTRFPLAANVGSGRETAVAFEGEYGAKLQH